MSVLTVFIYILLTTTISGTLGMAGGAILMAIFLIAFPIHIGVNVLRTCIPPEVMEQLIVR